MDDDNIYQQQQIILNNDEAPLLAAVRAWPIAIIEEKRKPANTLNTVQFYRLAIEHDHLGYN